MALTAGISSSPSFIPQANAADDEAAAVWMDEAEATMRREYLPRLVQFGLPEDAACFEGELADYFFFFVFFCFSRAPSADCLLVSFQSPRTIPTAPRWASSSARWPPRPTPRASPWRATVREHCAS